VRNPFGSGLAVVHELAIVGPAGACDGCKDKIRKFKAAWDGFARKAGYPHRGSQATLTVSFYYVNSHYNRNRKNTTLGTRKEGLPTKYCSVSRESRTSSGDGEAPSAEIAASQGDGVLSLRAAGRGPRKS
jgi:hypothetical protein